MKKIFWIKLMLTALIVCGCDKKASRPEQITSPQKKLQPGTKLTALIGDCQSSPSSLKASRSWMKIENNAVILTVDYPDCEKQMKIQARWLTSDRLLLGEATILKPCGEKSSLDFTPRQILEMEVKDNYLKITSAQAMSCGWSQIEGG